MSLKDHPLTLTGHPSLDQRYTFEQFLTVFDGYRAEWSPDGRVEVETVGNNIIHADMVAFLLEYLRIYLGIVNVGKVILQGFIQRTSPDLAAREPDLMVVLNENLGRVQTTYLDGPADIVVEVVSPESIERDYGVKFREYELGGVREYWLIDPERRIADVYALGEDGRYHRRALDSDGRITSGLLPKFAVSPDVLWTTPKPNPIGTLKLVAGVVGADPKDLL